MLLPSMSEPRAETALPAAMEARPPRQVSLRSLPPLLFEQTGAGEGSRRRFAAASGGLRVELEQHGALIYAGGASPIRMTLLGAGAAAKFHGGEPLAGRVVTMRGASPRSWRPGAAAFGRVEYQAVYPGIDLAFHGGQGHLEYDFVVAPGADPGRIAIRFDGAESVRLDSAGALMLRTSSGTLRQEPPILYQLVMGGRREVPGGYRLSGDRDVSFEVGSYDPSLPLVIDPRLVYSQSLQDAGSGRATVQGAAIAVDGAGFAYVTGAIDDDAFVAKLAPQGGSIVFLTIVGGGDEDAGTAIALGPRGDILIAGVTRSEDFPGSRPGRRRAPRQGAQDAFVVRLSPDGSRLLDAAILGGAGDDAAAGIALDATGMVFVTGTTSSYDFPTTGKALQRSLAGMDDVFVARLSANGLRRVYSTYLGGSGIDRGAALAVDARGRVHVAGSTMSADFPTASAAQPGYGGAGRAGGGDGFVAALDASGDRLSYSTFLGGQDDDQAAAIALDAQGAALIAGTTASQDFPTLSPIQAGTGGGMDVFIARLDAAGNLLNASCLGSADDERATGLAIDPRGDLFLAGTTSSSGWPGADAGGVIESGPASFVLRLRHGGKTLRDAARLGLGQSDGERGVEMVRGIAPGPEGDLYLTGAARDAGMWALDRPAVDHGAGFVARIDFGTLAAVCPGSMNFTNAGGTGLWADPNNWDDNSRIPEWFDDVCITGFDVSITSGSHTVNSLLVDGKLTITGTLTALEISADGQLNDVDLVSGVLSGAGTVNIDRQFNWRGGRVEGPAGHPSILNMRGTLTLEASSTFRELRSRILNVIGNVQHTAGTLSGGGAAVINLTGAWRADAGTVTNSFTGGGATFNNSGLLEKKTTANYTMGLAFNNTGTVDVKEGRLTYAGLCIQTAGSTLLNGGAITVSAMSIRGGILAGTGSITGNVLMAGGTLSPGFSPGSITIRGEYIQDAASIMNIEAGGLAAGTQFDQIVMEGTASVNLSGTLNVTLAAGYTPAFGDRLEIMTFGSRVGTFSTVNLPAPIGGVSFDMSYSPTALTLVGASQKSANLSLDKLDSPDPVLRDQTLTYTLKVTNSGPDEATDVKITDPLPGSTTFISATGPGWTCDISTGPLICTLPVLAVGANSSVTLEVVPTLAPSSMLNTATVASKEKDAVPGNNTAQQGTTVSLDTADLAISVTHDPDPVRIDSTIALHITVTNAGPSAAAGVRVIDTLPPGSSFAGFSGIGWLCLPGTGTASCVTNGIAPANSSTVDLLVTSPPRGGPAINTLVVSSNATDANPADNTASVTTTVLPAVADLSVVSADNPDPAGTFDPLAYTIVVANGGPDAAHGVVLVDQLPAGSAFVNARGVGWICLHASGVVTCTSSVLQPAASSIVEIELAAPGTGGTFTNSAVVSSEAGDPAAANNTSLQNTTVTLSHADLSAAVVESLDPVFSGEPLTYDLTVSNAGPNQANFLSVAAVLPPGATFVSAGGMGWTCSQASGTVTCTLAALPVGTAAPIQIAIAAPATGGLVVGQVSVAAATDDPNPANNSATCETIVFLPNADLSIAITDTPDPVVETGVVTYKLQVTNLGPDPVKRTKVVSTVPVGLTFVQAPAPGGPWTCSINLPNVTCFIAEIPPGPAPDINIGVPVPMRFSTMSNVATVSAVVADGNLSNNTETEPTTIVPVGANVSAGQETSPDPVESGLEFTYTLSAINHGPLTATDAQLVAVLPPEVEFVSAAPPPDATDTEPNGALKLTYQIGFDLPPNTGISVTVTARCVEANPALQSTVTVTATQFDPFVANNTHTKLTNCIGLNAQVLFTQRLISPDSTSLSMPAAITVAGGVIDPNSVAITRIDDEPITPIPATAASGKFNFNRQTLLRTIEAMLQSCTPLEGVPVKLRVSGMTTTGDFFTGTDTITYTKKSPCSDGSQACVTLKPTSVKVTSFNTDPVKATIGLCSGRIIPGTVRLRKVDGSTVPSLTATPTKNPNRVTLDRPALTDRILRAVGFCPAKTLKEVTLTFQGLTQSFQTFEITVPFVANCGSGV